LRFRLSGRYRVRGTQIDKTLMGNEKVYDGDGRRVKAMVNGVTTYYVGDYYEMSGGVVKKYYTAGGKRVVLCAAAGRSFGC
ncbi:MAG: hypothetical protein K6T87_02125, partial [Roseiflexus sp.]